MKHCIRQEDFRRELRAQHSEGIRRKYNGKIEQSGNGVERILNYGRSVSAWQGLEGDRRKSILSRHSRDDDDVIHDLFSHSLGLSLVQ